MDTVSPSTVSPDSTDVLMRTYRSPRCTAVSSVGKHCNKPRMRVNPKLLPAVYTQRCYSHGGAKEKYEFLLKTNTAVIEKRFASGEQAFLETLGCDSETGDRSSDPMRSGEGMVDGIGNGNPKGGGEGKELPASLPNPVIGGAHSNNHSQKNNLSEISLMLRNIITSISSKSASNLDADKVDRLLTRAEKLLKLMTSIAKVEKAQSANYSRETLKYDTLRILSVIKEYIPSPEHRRQLAIRLTEIFLPTQDSTVIIRKDFPLNG